MTDTEKIYEWCDRCEAETNTPFKNYEVYFQGDPEPHKVKAVSDESLFWFLEQEYYTDEILEIYEVVERHEYYDERELSLDSLVRYPRFTMKGYATIYH